LRPSKGLAILEILAEARGMYNAKKTII